MTWRGGPFIAGVWVGAVLAALLLLFTRPSHGHEWIEANGLRNVNGVLCCNRSDCAPIPHEVAWTARVGSTVIVPLLSGPQAAVINIVHASLDPEGRSFACTTGCLFRVSGY